MPVTMRPCNLRLADLPGRWLPGLCLLMLAAVANAGSSALQRQHERVYFVPQNQQVGLTRYLHETLFPESNKNIRRAHFVSEQQFFDLQDLFLLHRDSYVAISTTSDESAADQSQVTLVGNGQMLEFSGRGRGKLLTAGDRHSLLSRVKRVDRERFIAEIGSIGIGNPFALESVLTTTGEHQSYVLAVAGSDHLKVNLNAITSQVLGREQRILTLRIIPLTEQGQGVAVKVNKELERLFPALRPVSRNAYQLAYEHASANPVVTGFFLRHRLLFKLLQALLFAAIGILIITLLLKHRSYSNGITDGSP